MLRLASSSRWMGLLLLCVATASAQQPQQFKFNAGPDAAISISNDFGAVNVRPAAGRQITITATPSAQSAKAVATQSGNRIEVHTQRTQAGSSDPVNYEIAVPLDTRVSLRTVQGEIHVEKLKADVSAESDSGKISVSDIGSAHVHLRSLSGPMTLTNIRNGHVELTSVSGNLELDQVNGPSVSANTGEGNITARGNFGGAGDYSFSTHKGDINIFVPADISVPIDAHSVKDSVENELQQADSSAAVATPSQNTSFAGASNAGSSAVQLRSFSGKIRVKKQ